MKNHDTPTKMALLKRKRKTKTKTEDTQPPPRSTEQQAPLHWTNVVEMERRYMVERCSHAVEPEQADKMEPVQPLRPRGVRQAAAEGHA